MRKFLIICIFTLMTGLLLAQVSKTINVTTAGTLSTLLTQTEKTTITELVVTGDIDATDIKCMRDEILLLASIDMSNAKLAYIPSNAFYNSTKSQGKTTLTSVKLPNSITSIGSYAFGHCYNLDFGTLTISSSINDIGQAAFFGCKIKKIISLRTTPPTLGQQAFDSGTGSGTFIFVPAGTVDNYKAAWSGYTIATEKQVTIHNPNMGNLAATIIEAGYGPLSSITHLNVTGNLNSLDISQMNSNMTVLTEIDMTGSTIENNTIPSRAFYFKRTLITLKLPTNITTIGSSAFTGCGLLSDIDLPLSLLSIGNGSFSGCSHLTGSLKIPNSVASIGSSAFSGCSGFTGSLTIPNSVTSIGNNAFKDCYGFTDSLTISNTVTSIGDNVFEGCYGFTGNLIIPNSVISIGNQAFDGCIGLTGNLTIPNSVTTIGLFAFRGCLKFNQLKLGKNIASIKMEAFSGCSGISKISVARSVPPTIDASTFNGINKESCRLEVPTGSKLSYQTAQHWGLFIYVSEVDMLNSASKHIYNHIKIYVNNSDIIVEGTLEGDILKVYGINGVIFKELKSQGMKMTIPVQKNTVYIVKIDGQSSKVIL